MKDKTAEVLKEMRTQERDMIRKSVLAVAERCREILNCKLEIKYGQSFATDIADKKNGVFHAYFQIYKVEKEKFLWINRDRLTPICFVKDCITKSSYNEDWLEIELYDGQTILPILNNEMGRVAESLGAKTRIISVHGDGPIIEEYV